MSRFINRLVSNEIWVVVLLTALSVLSIQLLPAVVSVAILFFILRWIDSGKPGSRTPVDWAVILLVAMTPVTIFVTALPELTIPQVWRLLGGIALFYAIVNWATTFKRIYLLGWGFTTAGFLLAIMAPVSVDWSVSKPFLIPAAAYRHFPLLFSDTIHPNVLAGILILLLSLPLAWLVFNRDRKFWWLSLFSTITLFVMLIILLFSKSRGAWLALGTVMGALVLLRWRRGWVVVGLAILFSLAVILYVGVEPVVEAIVTGSSVLTIAGRQEVWSRAIDMIRDFPFTGVGMGTYGIVADGIYSFHISSPGSINHAHNIFLQIAVDVGIPGLVAWLAILCLSVQSAWQMFKFGKLKQDNNWVIIGAALFCSQIALIVHGLTDAATWGMVKTAPLVWALWGLTAAGVNMCEKKISVAHR